MKIEERKATYEGDGILKLAGNLNISAGEEITIRLSYQGPRGDAWLTSAAEETSERLSNLEREVDPDQLADWMDAMEKSSESARYAEGTGIVIEQQ